MGCSGCGVELPDDGRFCPHCGTRQPEEDPARVAEYREALEALAHRTEAWAVAELATLRGELEIRQGTHDRLLKSLSAAPVVAPLGVWFDEGTLADFKVGEQCLIQLRVVNEGTRALKAVAVSWRTTATDGAEHARTQDILGPGGAEILGLILNPSHAGHHRLTGDLEIVPLRGASTHWSLTAVPFRVAGHGALQQSIHIDARSQKVGIFENIGGGPTGGAVGAARWVAVPLMAGGPPLDDSGSRTDPSPTLGIGHRGTGRVLANDAEIRVEVDGHEGVLVELEDPGLRPILSPGNQLQVTVIGIDGVGRVLLSTRPPTPAADPPPDAGPTLQAGPGELAARIGEATAGATVQFVGTQQGPLVVDKALTLEGAAGACIEIVRGAALTLCADVVVRGVAIRGTAPKGHYAPDGITIRSGRVLIDGCDIAVDRPGNLTPGRGIAVVGAARVEIRDGAVHDCGVGIAVDVSWGGVGAGGAQGARVGVHGVTLHTNALGAAVAGPGRELHLARCTVSPNRDGTTADPQHLGGAVRALDGAVLTVEDCVLTPHTP